MTRRSSYNPNLGTYLDTEEEAREIFETFHAKSSHRKETMNFSWPKTLQFLGEAKAQLYRSNKWKMDPKVFEDYKHIAEGFQLCFAVPGFLCDWESRSVIDVPGPLVHTSELVGSPAPKHFSILAPLIAIQIHLYDEDGRKIRGDDGLFEVTVAHGMLGASRNPQTGRAFLFVYTRDAGVHMVIVGKKLDVKKDGIVG